MLDLAIATHPDGVLVVDSRLIAQELGIEHENFIDTISKYRTEAEQAFGVLRFETGKPSSGSLGGRPEKFVLLTEEQATFFMTLSRNTPEVVVLKVRLVKAFFDAKQKLLGQGFAQPPTTTIYIQRLQNMSDHNVPDDLWTTFREGAEVLLLVEKDYRVPVS
jgi:phage regulator Rha-like protein